MKAVAERVRALLDPPVPLPGQGQTATRWKRLTDAARADVVVGRLLEGNADADAILAELTSQRVEPGQWWGVWAAEPPLPVLSADMGPDDGWILNGTKAWCSGAGLCTHALVTARHGGQRPLLAVDLSHPGVSVDLDAWQAVGMSRSATGSVTFDHVPARVVGGPGDYLDRPGFWHGGVGVAACWLGGAEAVADTLRRAASRRPLDEHAAAHLGAVDAALAGATWSMQAAAAEVDADPTDRDAAQRRAMRVRAVVEAAATLTVDRVGRALGAAPLALDARHSTAVNDLTVYLRQSHAERDLAVLGRLASPEATR
ncbi:acyl-CoA dehydrogenase family protein [Lapillicoccus sp.]|uniref:acyl-CoA dehydrogenase family protein n=1 Tax=Lapillicoccus sp. TaxID=1909287 RepID=UPI00326569F4